MLINPKYWKLPQWICNIMLIVMVLTWKQQSYIFTPKMDYGGITPFTVASILVIMVAHVYCYGVYYDIEMERLIIYVGISAGIIFTEMFLCFSMGLIFKWPVDFKGMFLVALSFILYIVSLVYCFNKVEFTSVSLAELEVAEKMD